MLTTTHTPYLRRHIDLSLTACDLCQRMPADLHPTPITYLRRDHDLRTNTHIGLGRHRLVQPLNSRNAGGVITDDEVQSLVISQPLLGTREIILIHHTDCGMLTFTDDDFKAQIEADTGRRPGWAPESLRDPAADVKQSLARIATNPFIPHKDSVRDFVYSVTQGTRTEIA
jgi:hypothetical protein